jgi:hypothetical protein
MVKKFINYTGVTKAWRNKWKHSKGDWGWRYAREILEGILIVKDFNHGIVLDMRKRIRNWILFFVLDYKFRFRILFSFLVSDFVFSF